MAIRIICILLFCARIVDAAVGSWNGIAFTAWDGIAQTAWNGTSISCAAGGGGGLAINKWGTNAVTVGVAAPVTLTGVAAGAMLVATCASEGNNRNCTMASVPILTWATSADASSVNGSGSVTIFTTMFAAGGDITVTGTWSNSEWNSCSAWSFTGTEAAFGGATAAEESETAPSTAITTTRANSFIIGCISDWNATGPGVTFRAGATNALQQYGGSNYRGDHFVTLATTAQSYTVGESAPTGQSAGCAYVEVRVP